MKHFHLIRANKPSMSWSKLFLGALSQILTNAFDASGPDKKVNMIRQYAIAVGIYKIG